TTTNASPPRETREPAENSTSINEAQTWASRAMPEPCRAISASWSATSSREPNQRARQVCSLPCCRAGTISSFVLLLSVIDPPGGKGRDGHPSLPSGHLRGLLLGGLDLLHLGCTTFGFACRTSLLGLELAHLAGFHQGPSLIRCRLAHVSRLEDDQCADRLLSWPRIAPGEAQCPHGIGRDHEPGLLHLPLLENVGLGRNIQRHLTQHPILHAGDIQCEL